MQEASVISWLGGEKGEKEVWSPIEYSHGGSSGDSYIGSFTIIECGISRQE